MRDSLHFHTYTDAMDRTPASTSPSKSPPRGAGARLVAAWPWLLASVLIVLLAVLGTLQYRWLGRATEADRQRTAHSLSSAAERFAADFDHEMAYALVMLFRPTGGGATPPRPLVGEAAEDAAEDARADAEDLARRLAAWRERASWPGMVEAVWRVEAGEAGATARRLDEAAGRFEEVALPGDVRALVENASDLPSLPFLSVDPPALVTPRGGPRRHRGRMRHGAGPPLHRLRPEGFLVLLLDREVLEREVFPGLAARHFSVDEEGLVLRVVVEGAELGEGTGGSHPARAIWRRGELEDAAPVDPVAAEDLFSPLRLLRSRGPDADHRRHAAPWHHVLGGGMRHALAAEVMRERPRWRLEVIHPAGSLDAAVAAARRGGLALSLGILLVLAVTVLLMAQALRRSQALARRQMDFVAGITHELRTPLAALRSAGQNLSDGLVDGERVRRYGRLVEREGRRLEETVDQVLAYAGLRSGAPAAPADRTWLDPKEEAERAVADLAPLLEDEDVKVELRAAGELPAIHADRAALGRALRNLLVNAVRHGQPEADDGPGWVGLEVTAPGDEADEGSGGHRVAFRVRDRGPGVDPADRRRIFEPFVRGAGLAASNVPGNGLGLALVRRVAESHGGSVRLESGPEAESSVGRGATFVLELPVGTGTEDGA